MRAGLEKVGLIVDIGEAANGEVVLMGEVDGKLEIVVSEGFEDESAEVDEEEEEEEDDAEEGERFLEFRSSLLDLLSGDDVWVLGACCKSCSTNWLASTIVLFPPN